MWELMFNGCCFIRKTLGRCSVANLESKLPYSNTISDYTRYYSHHNAYY